MAIFDFEQMFAIPKTCRSNAMLQYRGGAACSALIGIDHSASVAPQTSTSWGKRRYLAIELCSTHFLRKQLLEIRSGYRPRKCERSLIQLVSPVRTRMHDETGSRHNSRHPLKKTPPERGLCWRWERGRGCVRAKNIVRLVLVRLAQGHGASNIHDFRAALSY